MEQQTIIITGATGTLGSASVQHFGDHGFNVVGLSRRKSLIAPTSNIHLIENCDLTNFENAQSAIAQTIEKYSKPTVLINIAGGFIWKEIVDTSYDDIDTMMDLNFKTLYNMTKATLEALSETSCCRIINIGATGAITAAPGMAAYAISKSAVMRYTEALAAETSDNITVNALMPSIIDTPQNRKDMPNQDFSKWLAVDKIIAKMAYLISLEAQNTNGKFISFNG